MKFLQETSATDYPNHTYLVTDDRSKVLGYVRSGTDQLEMFRAAKNFDPRGRKFKEVENRWDLQEKQTRQRQWQITGSRGNQYTVTETADGLTCSCPGYTYRQDCKHVHEVAAR